MEKYLLVLLPFLFIGWIVFWAEMGTRDRVPLWLAFMMSLGMPLAAVTWVFLYFLG